MKTLIPALCIAILLGGCMGPAYYVPAYPARVIQTQPAAPVPPGTQSTPAASQPSVVYVQPVPVYAAPMYGPVWYGPPVIYYPVFRGYRHHR